HRARARRLGTDTDGTLRGDASPRPRTLRNLEQRARPPYGREWRAWRKERKGRMSLYAALIQPFAEYGFMPRALVACPAPSLGCGPIGTFLVLRRMSLMGDVMSHAILPGAALGFLVAGLSLWAMSAGGLMAGLAVALLAGLVSRATALREDASLAGFYLISLA